VSRRRIGQSQSQTGDLDFGYNRSIASGRDLPAIPRIARGVSSANDQDGGRQSNGGSGSRCGFGVGHNRPNASCAQLMCLARTRSCGVVSTAAPHHGRSTSGFPTTGGGLTFRGRIGATKMVGLEALGDYPPGPCTDYTEPPRQSPNSSDKVWLPLRPTTCGQVSACCSRPTFS
jgi:hypothetical protein